MAVVEQYMVLLHGKGEVMAEVVLHCGISNCMRFVQFQCGTTLQTPLAMCSAKHRGGAALWDAYSGRN